MQVKVRAIYQKGAFVPQEPCTIPEDSEVELLIEGPQIIPPEVTDPAERTRVLKAVVERMKHNLMPAAAPRLTRQQLHDRG